MTALTAARDTPKKSQVVPEYLAYPVAADGKPMQGGLVAVNTAGNAVAASADVDLRVVGVAVKTADNTGGAAGAINVEAWQGIHRLGNSGTTGAITAADVGRECYVVDDQTVSRLSGNGARPVAGRVVAVDSNGVWVRVGTTEGEQAHIDVQYVAAADLRTKQGYAIKLDGDVKAAVAGAGEASIGILLNAPNTGETAIIRAFGVAKGIAGAAIDAGTRVASDAAGKLKAASEAVVNTSDAGAAADPSIGSNVLGILLADVAADGDAVSVLVTPQGALPKTAA